MKNKEPLSEGVVNIVRGLTRPALSFFGLVSLVRLLANSFDIPEYFTTLVRKGGLYLQIDGFIGCPSSVILTQLGHRRCK